MKLGEAVARARQHLYDLFSGQRIADLGVDAIVFDDHLRVWTVTLGFLRPEESGGRELKTMRIADGDGQVISAN